MNLICFNRSKIYSDNTESNKTVEELQNRIRSNIDSIQMLNHQVNIFNKRFVLHSEYLLNVTSRR